MKVIDHENKNADSGVTIRKMKQKDLQILLRLGKAHWKNDNWLTINYLKSSFEQAGLSYVAKLGDKTVGGVILVFEDIVKNWIRFLIVDKSYRKQGVGRLLLQKIFGKIKQGESVFVDTGVSDKNAIRFYEKMGFKNRGMVRSLYGNVPAYFFEKVIRKNINSKNI